MFTLSLLILGYLSVMLDHRPGHRAQFLQALVHGRWITVV